MKKNLFKSMLVIVAASLVLVSCKKLCFNQEEEYVYELKPSYSTINEFRQGITNVVNMIQSHRIVAYLDTLPDGYPNINGRKASLASFGAVILEKLYGNDQQVQSAVYDIFHFDEATFSLVSYLMKAQMVNDISAQTLVNITAAIPLPPIPVANFQAPVKIVAKALGGDCCTDNVCNPKIKILVTWTYKSPCGNFDKKSSGYAVNNKLTLSGGRMYRFTPEISGCPCPGTLTSKVTTPAGASYGEAVSKDGSVTVLPVTPGAYTITFTYKVCDITVTETFNLTVR